MTRGAETRVAADALVLATCTVAETTLQDELAQDEVAVSDLEVHVIGDCVAPRRANNAFHEGRRLALKL